MAHAQARDVGVSSPRARDAFDDLVSAGVSPTSPLDHYGASPRPAGAGSAAGSAWRPEQPSTSEGTASAFTSWCACCACMKHLLHHSWRQDLERCCAHAMVQPIQKEASKEHYGKDFCGAVMWPLAEGPGLLLCARWVRGAAGVEAGKAGSAAGGDEGCGGSPVSSGGSSMGSAIKLDRSTSLLSRNLASKVGAL